MGWKSSQCPNISQTSKFQGSTEEMLQSPVMKRAEFVFLVFALSGKIAACGATSALHYADTKNGDIRWLVEGRDINGTEVLVPARHHHQFNMTLHCISSCHPLITTGSLSLDLGNLTENTSMTLKFACASQYNCTVQIGKTVKTTALPDPFVLQAEERASGKYFLTYHQPDEEANTDKISHPKWTSGSPAALTTVVMAMLGILLVVVLSSWRLSLPVSKRRAPVISSLPHLQEPLLPTRTRAPHDIPSTIEEECSNTLWEAVAAGDIEEVESLLEKDHDPWHIEPRRTTSPLLDAHILGQRHVLQVFANYLDSADNHEEFIEQVLQEWNKMTRQVFVAAECGMYNYERGVAALLHKYHLPGTLRDECGKSLIHYMASPTAVDGSPPWEAEDIVKFLTNHEHFINSVDFHGRTALHYLAEHFHSKHEKIIWSGREWAVEEAWVSVAELLTQYGCDPRLADDTGTLAHTLAANAANHDLAQFLQTRCEQLGGPDLDSVPAVISRAARAARRGDTSLLKKLLDGFLYQSPAHPTPAIALATVLLEGVLGGQRESVMILLCAGASPLSGAGPGHLTPLYAAQISSGMPAVIPALLRQACYHQLQEEASCPHASEDLRHALQHLAERLLAEGVQAKWLFKNSEDDAQTVEAQNLLRIAGNAGLPLACRVLGQQKQFLHSLPPIHVPLLDAHPSAQAVLLHELDMMPLGGMGLEDIALYGPAADSRCGRELKIIEEVLERETNSTSQTAARKIRSLLRNEKTAFQEPVPTKIMFEAARIAAQFGLAAAINKMITHWPNLDFTAPVSPVWSGKTMHVGVLWGQVCVVELLAYLGIGMNDKVSGGMSPSHVAALIGDTKMLTFLKQHQQRMGLTTEEICSAGLTPHQLLASVQEWTGRHAELTHTETLGILLLPRGASRATEMVKLRLSRLGVSSVKDLLRVSRAWMEPVAEMTYAKMEVQRLSKAIAASGLCGELFPAGHVMGSADHLVLLYVMQGDNLKSTKPQALREAFTNKLQEALEDQVATTPELCAMPPILTNTNEGLTLMWLCTTRPTLQLLRLTLVPAVAINPGPTLPFTLAGASMEQDTNLYAVPTTEGWMCLPSVAMSAAITSLESEWKQTWATCHFLNKMLEPRWWSPAHISHHTGVNPLPDCALASALLQQQAEYHEKKEGEDLVVLRRILAVFSRAAHEHHGRVWQTLDDISPECPPESRPLPVEVAEGMLLYLKELLQTTVEMELAPRVTFKE